MAKTLGDKAAKQIAGAIRRVGQLPPNDAGGVTGRRGPVFEPIICGKIDGTMARSGTATLSIYKPSTTGGIGTDTTVNQKIIDIGQITSDHSPLVASTVVSAAYCRGSWILISYDCDAQ